MTLALAHRSATFRERLLSKIYPQPEGCWLWAGKPNKDGYGRIRVGEGGDVLAHRASYEEFVGPIPKGLVIDHLCLNKMCVNPEHLEPVTAGENTRRNLNCPSTKNRLLEQCHKGHPFTQYKNQRRCDACRKGGPT